MDYLHMASSRSITVSRLPSISFIVATTSDSNKGTAAIIDNKAHKDVTPRPTNNKIDDEDDDVI